MNVKDAYKITSLLALYNEILESEKKYERNIVMETLKLVVSLGYTILRK